jgi:DNA repair protein RecO (recombination protein O)
MEWSDDAVVLGLRPFGENDAVLDVFARAHGRSAGLLYGGAGRKRQHLQPGNGLIVTWKARLETQLGFFSGVETTRSRAAAAIADPLALVGLGAALALVRAATPERVAFPKLFDALIIVLDNLAEPDIWPALYVRFELGLLAEMGYGLELDSCAVTGASGPNAHLTHVSPRTGRAVSAEAAAPYLDRLLDLPGFLSRPSAPDAHALAAGFRLAGHFLERRLFAAVNQPLPEARTRLIDMLARQGRLRLASPSAHDGADS